MSERTPDNADTERLARFYRRAADAEPDARLDEAVLGRARRAASRPRRRYLKHPGAWGVGLAAAASLVLGVGLVLQGGWQPAPESDSLEQFRARAEREAADQPAAPAAIMEDRAATEPKTEKAPAELNRTPVTDAQVREEAHRESQRAESDEAEMAAPIPTEEGESLEPEEWVERIRGLAEAGEVDAARKELRAFRETHPDVEVPRDLRERLEDEGG